MEIGYKLYKVVVAASYMAYFYAPLPQDYFYVLWIVYRNSLEQGL